MKPLDQLLREWRATMGFSKAEAARHCKVSEQHWGLLESGQRFDLRGATFRKLTEGTGIPRERIVLAAALLRERRLEASPA